MLNLIALVQSYLRNNPDGRPFTNRAGSIVKYLRDGLIVGKTQQTGPGNDPDCKARAPDLRVCTVQISF